MELGESQAVIPEQKEKKEEAEKTKIRLSVFFDGTLNNRTNINIRLVSARDETLTQEEREMAKEIKGEMSPDKLKKAKKLYKKYDDEDSFLNGYTNIAKLEKHLECNPVAPYDHAMSSYIEGAGTNDEEKDRRLGYGLGLGGYRCLEKS